MKFEDSLNNGQHHKLSMMVGEWKGTTRVWFGPDQLADESEMTGTIRSALMGRFLIHEYKGLFQGKPIEGLATYGYDLAQNKFQSAWIDSFHMSTGIMLSESDEHKKDFVVKGSYKGSPENPQLWGWRTEIELTGIDELTITMYNISPQGDEAKAVETKYVRC